MKSQKTVAFTVGRREGKLIFLESARRFEKLEAKDFHPFTTIHCPNGEEVHVVRLGDQGLRFKHRGQIRHVLRPKNFPEGTKLYVEKRKCRWLRRQKRAA